ncbi:hypothetical protein MC7420_3170 [Coleofasciculus chthonoplastes PCC 7420]|uniref:Uncharacterized protein n=1 Tax=Coleofasciculus chthonoplastes PCC 7420 TaxID=118168 RepID=B4VK87_9CYAN|nr:hypothetical protein MC7420_3170 [Coleofasciculus chthonoplastes PCC 7420]
MMIDFISKNKFINMEICHIPKEKRIIFSYPQLALRLKDEQKLTPLTYCF